ncbi:YebG family protein [Marinomonas dokdonensis]|uniref:YebG family protein n=1 Tax=Marinomonas dokdonensis TaxID=328224 RepID=UPI0040553DC5
MPVVIKYVVERDGIEKMTFTSKAEADAYDKLLDTADALYDLLEGSELITEPKQTEALAMFLAEQKEPLLEALGSKKKSSTKTKKAAPKKSPQLELADESQRKTLEDIVIEPDEDALYEEDSSTGFSDDTSFDTEDAA